MPIGQDITSDFPVQPSTVWLTTNRQCQFRCRWCYAQATGFANESMSLDLSQRLLLVAKELGAKSVTLIGGEPTLWDHLLSTNSRCRELGLRTTLVTNAFRFADDAYWDRYCQSPSSDAGVSLKAADAAHFQTDVGLTDFERMCKGVRRAVELHNCGVSVVYNTHSVASLTDLAQLAMDLGARSFSIGFCTPVFDESTVDTKYMVPPRDIVRHVVADYPRLVDITGGRLNIAINSPLCLWPKEFITELDRRGQAISVCQVHRRSGVVLGVQGEVLICNNLHNFPMGRFGVEFEDAAGLLALLNSREVLSHYDGMHRYPHARCQGCEDYAKCAGGCPLLWAAYSPNDLIQIGAAPFAESD